MARAPIEGGLDLVTNHFELCAIASKRARQLVRGAPSLLSVDDHKSTVLSLLEIAGGLIDRKILLDAEMPLIESPRIRLEVLDPFGET